MQEVIQPPDFPEEDIPESILLGDEDPTKPESSKLSSLTVKERLEMAEHFRTSAQKMIKYADRINPENVSVVVVDKIIMDDMQATLRNKIDEIAALKSTIKSVVGHLKSIAE